MIKKRWLSLFVENEIGVLARISGLFSSKSYNLDSLTVGTTEDNTISRMTISLTSDDKTFEQIKKQLNRCVEVIKVIDLTDTPIHIKELMFIKLCNCTERDINRLACITDAPGVKIVKSDMSTVLIESAQTENENNNLLSVLEKSYTNRIEIVRGGSVAIEAI